MLVNSLHSSVNLASSKYSETLNWGNHLYIGYLNYAMSMNGCICGVSWYTHGVCVVLFTFDSFSHNCRGLAEVEIKNKLDSITCLCFTSPLVIHYTLNIVGYAWPILCIDYCVSGPAFYKMWSNQCSYTTVTASLANISSRLH